MNRRHVHDAAEVVTFVLIMAATMILPLMAIITLMAWVIVTCWRDIL